MPHRRLIPLLAMVAPCLCLARAALGQAQAFPDETRVQTWDSGVRALINTPAAAATVGRGTLLIVYATPNGNSAEWTFGGLLGPGIDWHYDIQHALAQVRLLRDLDPGRRVVLVVVQPENKSWPAWRRAANEKSAGSGDETIRQLVEELRTSAGLDATLALTGHSGGGSFITGYLNAHESLPLHLQRIAYLDANYSFDDDQGHSLKLLTWLQADAAHRLISLAYDDREVTLGGRKVVSDTGGTYRATDRMAKGLGQNLAFISGEAGPFTVRSDAADQVRLVVRQNPENIIWHTRLVELNGLLYCLTAGTPLEKRVGELGGWRAYSSYIGEPMTDAVATGAPATRSSSNGTSATGALVATWANLPTPEREARILAACLAEGATGQMPGFLRRENFIPITVTAVGPSGKSHTATIRVSGDYFSVGTIEDFVRLPLTPGTAGQIASSLGCQLPTRKLVNDIYAAATIKLEPRPLTKDRESVAAFLHHNRIITGQLPTRPTSQPAAVQLTAGHKKDIVLTPRLAEKPDKVAIYGWHRLTDQPDQRLGLPIQPLYVGHAASYVDYSHGARFVDATVMVDGRPMQLSDVLADPELSCLVSDEGPFTIPKLAGHGR